MSAVEPPVATKKPDVCDKQPFLEPGSAVVRPPSMTTRRLLPCPVPGHCFAAGAVSDVAVVADCDLASWNLFSRSQEQKESKS